MSEKLLSQALNSKSVQKQVSVFLAGKVIGWPTKICEHNSAGFNTSLFGF